MTMLQAVNTTIEAIEPTDADSSAVELARLYARQLDQAATVRRAADKTLRDATADGDEALIEQVTALRAKLGERECVDRIGARLHALLTELQATPKARGGQKQPGRPAGKLAALRAVR